ncbi:MAG: S-layer homology domain-containing protein [Lachnospiraceae bacterium]|nr:S-layer homology domain-containing protein [Lachnospiraceae bacterium]
MYKRILATAVALTLIFSMQCGIYAEENTIRRDELANKIMDCYEYVTQEFSAPLFEQPVFNDINDSLFGYRILQCYAAGFMDGVGDKKFEPTLAVTKSQAAVALYRLVSKLNAKYDIVQAEEPLVINDLYTAPIWASNSIEYMVLNGFMPLDNGKFYPNDEISETELDGIIERIKDIFVLDDERERIDFETFLTKVQRG